MRIGFSVERRSAMAQSAHRIDLVREAVPQPKDFPTLPSHEGLINSPGTELAYRLPASNTTGWRLLATTIFSLLWNAVGCVLFVIAARGWLDGSVNWFLTAFLVPYLTVCGGSMYFVLRQIWIDAGMGPTSGRDLQSPAVARAAVPRCTCRRAGTLPSSRCRCG